MPDAPFVPAQAHPVLRALFAAMRAGRMTHKELSDASGVAVRKLSWWRTSPHRCRLTLDDLDACLRVFGYQLTITRIPKPEATDAPFQA